MYRDDLNNKNKMLQFENSTDISINPKQNNRIEENERIEEIIGKGSKGS
jgi:hypothetical protein